MTITVTRPIAAEYTRAAGDSEHTRTFIATTAGVKRDGLDIILDGMSTENFMRNPVFLYVHDYFGERLPIGKVTSIRTTKKKMTVKVLFDADDEFAMEVLRKYDSEFLNAVSIGWETLEFDRDTNQVLQSDLLDVSAVPVPGDPDALIQRQRSLMRSLGQDLLDRFDDGFEGGAKCPRCETPIDGDYLLVDSVVHCVTCGNLELAKTSDQLTISPPVEIEPTADGWRQFDANGTSVTITGTVSDPEALSLKISEAISDQRSGEPVEQTTREVEKMERLETLVVTLDAFRAALSDLIDSADHGDTDESFAALLRAFPEPDGDDNDDEGEKD